MPECTRIFPSPPCCWTQALSGQSQFLGRLGDYMETKNCSEYTNHLDCFKMYWDDWGNWKPAFRYLIKSKNRSTMYTCVSRVWIICIQVMSQNYRRHCWRTDIIKMTTNPTTYFFIIMWNGWTCLLIGFFFSPKIKLPSYSAMLYNFLLIVLAKEKLIIDAQFYVLSQTFLYLHYFILKLNT